METRVTRALLDTSVVIAGAESVRLQPGQTAAISVITLGELRAGVQLAGDPATHAVRQARLVAVRDTFEPIPIDEWVAEHYGDILAAARSEKRTSKATDLLIIATAATTGRILHTLDEAQAGLARLVGVLVQS
jgi:predicted nucleic acid-binding protein